VEPIRTREIAGLEVREHVVGDAAGSALPIVVSLHGRGGIPELPFGVAIRPCRLLVPTGPFVVGTGRAWSTHHARGGRDDELARDLAEVADRLRAMVEAVKAERGATERAIALGFSQGAMAALALATRHDDLISDVVGGAAWLPPALEPAGKTRARVRLAHGEADDIVPFSWARALSERMAARELDVALRSFPGVGHASSPEMDALLAAWRDAAIARAWGEPEPAIASLGREGPEIERGLWARVHAFGRRAWS
jgi:phospholipase/carboxylesterase